MLVLKYKKSQVYVVVDLSNMRYCGQTYRYDPNEASGNKKKQRQSFF
ncbi:MAG: hypothetical protein AB8Y71_00890 [Coxiella endosymbiont of Haemaphysalis qinghaiensis]